MSGPIVLYKLSPAWVLLDSGESMRVWFDSFGVEGGRIQRLDAYEDPYWDSSS